MYDCLCRSCFGHTKAKKEGGSEAAQGIGNEELGKKKPKMSPVPDEEDEEDWVIVRAEGTVLSTMEHMKMYVA